MSSRSNKIVYWILFFLFCLLMHTLVATHYNLYDWAPLPVLTPLADALAFILSPMTPLLGPYIVFTTIRCWKHPNIRSTRIHKNALFATAMQYIPRCVCLALVAARWVRGEEIESDEIVDGTWTRAYDWWKLVVEAVLLVLLVTLETMGIQWDGGSFVRLLDRNWEKFVKMQEAKGKKRDRDGNGEEGLIVDSEAKEGNDAAV